MGDNRVADAPGGGKVAPLGVRVERLSKSFRQGQGNLLVLDQLSAAIAPGSFVSVLGPSGSGKSTLLNILAGLDEPSAGSVQLYDAVGEVAGPRLGRVGLMPQRDLLLPWRDAVGNAVVGLEVRGVKADVARRAALAMFGEVGLIGFAASYPYQLSGGMRQRVSFVRSALAGGALLLLDEPFGALDALTRRGMQEWLLEAWARLGSTIVFVTHDVDEAITLADRVLVLTARPARIALDLPLDLSRPRTTEVLAGAAFAAAKRELLETLHATGATTV